MNKKTYLIKARPGTFVMGVSKEVIENDLSLKNIIQEYISNNEVEKASNKTICFFVVEEKVGNKKTTKKYHIGEVYSLEQIENEFGTNCSLYRNIKNNDYQSAIKYITGNFGGVDKEDVCFSQKEIIDILKEEKNQSSELSL